MLSDKLCYIKRGRDIIIVMLDDTDRGRVDIINNSIVWEMEKKEA